MAQTDQRTGGFRLPWSSDQRSIAEQVVKDGDPDADPQDMTATDMSDREDGGQTQTANDDTTTGTVASAESETAGSAAADSTSTETDTVPAETATLTGIQPGDMVQYWAKDVKGNVVAKHVGVVHELPVRLVDHNQHVVGHPVE